VSWGFAHEFRLRCELFGFLWVPSYARLRFTGLRDAFCGVRMGTLILGGGF
jgi:hypothetical protein